MDLANAFFCLPLATHLRDIFSFTFQGRQLRYTRVPQRFALSPGLFNKALRHSLDGLPLPEGVTLIQYVDDLLVAAPSAEDCLTATKAVLTCLHQTGFKVSRSKLQACRQQVSFLGRVLSPNGAGISPAHRDTILHYPRPSTVQDMLSFLGLTGYSRNFVPNYAQASATLRALCREHGMRNLKAPLTWTTEAEQVFIALKQTLTQTADLALPDYSIPFHLDVSESGDHVNGVLFQKKGGRGRC